MNEDNLTAEYKKKWEQVRLSDSTRLNMEKSLLEHARFYNVTETPVPVRSPFTWLLMKPVQFAFMFVLMIGVGSAFYLGGRSTVTPLATNEAPTDSQTTPAPTFESETPTTPDKLAIAPKNTNTSPVSDDVASEYYDNARTVAAKESAGIAGDEMFTTMLSQGAMDIDDYRNDVSKREKTYRALITKYDTSIEDSVRANLIAKLNTTLTLVAETDDKSETEARPLLDKATTLVGEVESTLSLLGNVTIEEGIIVDIDFNTKPGSTEPSEGNAEDLVSPESAQ